MIIASCICPSQQVTNSTLALVERINKPECKILPTPKTLAVMVVMVSCEHKKNGSKRDTWECPETYRTLCCKALEGGTEENVYDSQEVNTYHELTMIFF